MDDTTLHTFLFHCPAALRSLILLGSWDNFTRPYSLELDARRGRNYWRGCFTFSDIICDGDLDDLTQKRNGPLKMGGTYWYYYKVDGDEECHNPSEPSTTVCPLLPGQRLNVLEVPSEGHSRSNSEPSVGFTRNPGDRYLNPVPPVPQRPGVSPQLCPPSPYALPLPSPWTPRSATYPPAQTFLSPNVVRHARSASASPNMPSTPLFADFKGLKDKLAARRSANRNRSSSKSSELEIGAPVLISTTNKDLNLIPLGSCRSASFDVPRENITVTPPVTRPVPTINKEFSPLSSHPVDLARDPIFADTELARPPIQRRRSHIPSTVVTSEFRISQNRHRANSADTRRTKHYLFSNDPWLSSPKIQETFELADTEIVMVVPPMPMLQRPAASLAPPEELERPTSSHGGSSTPTLRQAPLDKDLPELPRYLTPAPLFACNSPSAGMALTEEPAEDFSEELYFEESEDNEVLGDLIMEYEEQPRSHFSTWSSISIPYSCSVTDEEIIPSPTFSSLASNFSDSGSPQIPAQRYSFAQTIESQRTSIVSASDEELVTPDEATPTIHFSATPPQLEDVRISTFGSDLFSLDIQHADAAPRRQAACFGLGFHYSLPEDDTTSKTTITEQTEGREPTINVQRESSVSQLTRLMDDFGYLGEAVI